MNTNLKIYLVAKTHTGMVREQNEDNFIATEHINGTDWFLPKEPFINTPEGAILALADGMGGMNAGEIASRIAIESVKETFSRINPAGYKEEKILSVLRNAILQAHRAIVQRAKKDKSLSDMGTTLVIGWILEGRLFIAWAGDSRCYYYRESTGLRQLSKDHSYVQTLVDEGKITAEQAFYHPQSNIVLQSLGDAEKAPEPDTAILNLAKGDILLLCSDGLNGMLTDEQIAHILRTDGDNPPQCVDNLIGEANAAGGVDNVTVILSKVLEGREPSAEDERQQPSDGVAAGDRKGRKRQRQGFLLLALFFLLASMIVPFMIYHPGGGGTISGGPDSVHHPKKDTPRTVPRGKTVETGKPADSGGKARMKIRDKEAVATDSLRVRDLRDDTVRLHLQPPDRRHPNGNKLPPLKQTDDSTHH